MSEKNDKGKLLGKCNRAACPNRPATWYSSVELAHYCQPCAIEINRHVPPGVSKLYKASTLTAADPQPVAAFGERNSGGTPE